MKARLIKKDGHYDLYVESIGLYTSTYQWTSNGNLLSIENLQAIERGYELDELAEEFAKNHSIYPTAQDDTEYGFKHGFQKALELMGDKNFSEEDIEKAIEFGANLGLADNIGNSFEWSKKIKEHIQSLQQTEWDVEIEMENTLENGYKNQPANTIGFVAEHKSVPKLDGEGCLILKRV